MGMIIDPWLSDILNVSCFKTTLFSYEDALNAREFISNQRADGIFATIRNFSNDTRIPQLLADSGIYFVVQDLQFYKEKFSSLSKESSDYILITPQEALLERAFCDLAGRSFLYSRFNLDPNINPDIASLIKVEWVKSFFYGKRGSYIVTLPEPDKLAFALIIETIEDECLTLIVDLIVVSLESRCKGLGSKLLQSVEQLAVSRGKELDLNLSRVKIGTQAINIPAVNLYTKYNYLLSSSSSTFHVHI